MEEEQAFRARGHPSEQQIALPDVYQLVAERHRPFGVAERGYRLGWQEHDGQPQAEDLRAVDLFGHADLRRSPQSDPRRKIAHLFTGARHRPGDYAPEMTMGEDETCRLDNERCEPEKDEPVEPWVDVRS